VPPSGLSADGHAQRGRRASDLMNVGSGLSGAPKIHIDQEALRREPDKRRGQRHT
jgi:hypothetical protein